MPIPRDENQQTPSRSSFKGKGPKVSGREKKNVTFLSDPTLRQDPLSKAPILPPSVLARSFGSPTPRQNQRKSYLKQEDDPNDRNYTTTDEEADEFRDEPYEMESSPEFESEESEESEDEGEDEINWDDSYVVEQHEKSVERKKQIFQPYHDLPRTPPTKSSNTVQERENSNQVTVLGPEKTVRYDAIAKSNWYTPKRPKRGHQKNFKISKYGSPEVQDTVNNKLRNQMLEQDTPYGPAGSGFRSAVDDPNAFLKLRRNLKDEYHANVSQIPPDPPSPFPDGTYSTLSHSPKFNSSLFIILLACFWFLINQVQDLGVSNWQKSFSNTVSNPGKIIPVISSAVMSIPETIYCMVAPCESTTVDRLKIIAMITTDTTIDITALTRFSDLITGLGVPTIFTSIASALAADIKDESSYWGEEETTITVEQLATDYQEANMHLRLLIGASQNLVRTATKKWKGFSGFLTDQIPKKVRNAIDLPSGWTIGVPATRKQHSGKALRSRYMECRKEIVKLYQYVYSIAQRSSNSSHDILERTRALHASGIYEASGALQVLEPLVVSIDEIQRHIAFQLKFFGSNEISEGIGGDVFTFEILKWRVESLWTSVVILQDSAIGRINSKKKSKGGIV